MSEGTGLTPADPKPGPFRTLLRIFGGAAVALGSGLVAYASLSGLFQLLSDTGGMNRPMTKGAALRFLVANGTLALGHILVLVMAFRRWKALAFRIPLLAFGLAALGALLLNPFTQCAMDTVRR